MAYIAAQMRQRDKHLARIGDQIAMPQIAQPSGGGNQLRGIADSGQRQCLGMAGAVASRMNCIWSMCLTLHVRMAMGVRVFNASRVNIPAPVCCRGPPRA